MTDPADALLEDMLAVPGQTAEVALGPGASIQAGWRTNGIPLLTADTTGCLPMLVVTSGRNRLVIGFRPHEDLGPEYAALVEQLVTAADALAVEVGRLARGKAGDLADPADMVVDEACALPSWVNHVHLLPGLTHIKMEPCEGDVPWLDFLSGGEALCSVSFDVAQVEDLRLEHLAVAGQLAAAAREFAHDVRAVVDAAVREPELES